MKILLRRLIVWAFTKKTGETLEQLRVAYAVHYFISRNWLRAYWLTFRR